MSWIKDNQFIVTLGGITLVGAAAIIVVGMQFSSKYSESLASYQEASTQVGDAENLPLYPNPENVRGKEMALKKYREDVASLQNAVFKYRPEALVNIAPQEFTTRAKAATTEVTAAFNESDTKFPEQFFCGFESYAAGTLARETATGILDYELGAAKEMFMALAKAAPESLANVHRERLPEEDGTAWAPAATDVARALPFEVTFRGSEKSVRNFLSALAKSEKYYYVIRTMRVTNQKRTAPVSSDAKFDAPAPAPETSGAPATGFVLPGDAAAGATPAPAEPAVDAAPAHAAADTSRILTQIAGAEDLTVFIRVDVMQFLPVKDLPQP